MGQAESLLVESRTLGLESVAGKRAVAGRRLLVECTVAGTPPEPGKPQAAETDIEQVADTPEPASAGVADREPVGDRDRPKDFLGWQGLGPGRAHELEQRPLLDEQVGGQERVDRQSRRRGSRRGLWPGVLAARELQPSVQRARALVREPSLAEGLQRVDSPPQTKTDCRSALARTAAGHARQLVPAADCKQAPVEYRMTAAGHNQVVDRTPEAVHKVAVGCRAGGQEGAGSASD